MNIAGIGQSLAFRAAIMSNSNTQDVSDKEVERPEQETDFDRLEIGLLGPDHINAQTIKADTFSKTTNTPEKASTPSKASTDSSTKDDPYRYGVAE